MEPTEEQLTKPEVSPKVAKYHAFSVRNRYPGEIMRGATTVITVDGQPLKGCKSFEFKVGAKGVAEIKLELYGEVCIDNVLAEFEAKYVVPETRFLSEVAKDTQQSSGHEIATDPHQSRRDPAETPDSGVQ